MGGKWPDAILAQARAGLVRGEIGTEAGARETPSNLSFFPPACRPVWWCCWRRGIVRSQPPYRMNVWRVGVCWAPETVGIPVLAFLSWGHMYIFGDCTYHCERMNGS